MKTAPPERPLNAEPDVPLIDNTRRNVGNSHNGMSQKTMLTGSSKRTLDIPRNPDDSIIRSCPDRSGILPEGTKDIQGL